MPNCSRISKNYGSVIPGAVLSFILILALSCFTFSNDQGFPDEEYRVWIQNEVDPIISDEEKGFFSSLDVNTDRDDFIKAFWESLDPTPGTKTNEFKNEHYRRLQVAVTRFSLNGKPGTDTSRGKVYVKLGEPIQILNYNSPSLVSYIEAWFYPPSINCGIKYPFFVLFYIPEGKKQYEIYVPGADDPYQLLATRFPGTRREMNEYALKSLFRIEPLLGQLSLNIIPSEHKPILHNNDTELRRALSRVNQASKTLMKVLVSRPNINAEERLSRIVNLMEGKKPKHKFEENTFTGKLIHSTRVYRNERGNPTYFVSAFIPSRDVLFKESFGKCYAYLKADIEAYDKKDDLINSKTEYISAAYSSWNIFNRSAPFLGYEGYLELPEGEYRISVKISNHSGGKAFSFQEKISIPQKRQSNMQLSKPSLLLKNVKRDYHSQEKAYSFGNQDIHPAPEASFTKGQDAEVYYQLYFPRRDRVSTVTVRYIITYRNRVLWRGRETLTTDQMNKGSFFSRAIKLPTRKLHNGKYKLTILAKTLSPPEARTSLEFVIVNRSSFKNTPIMASITK